ncbi:MAG TPA: hypothetical protein VF420_16415 [Casimicrobiaceae bacterium]
MVRKSGIGFRAPQVVAALFGMTVLVSGQAAAQTQMQPEAWKFDAYIYGYFPQLGGSLTFPTGTTANITVDANKVISNLKFAAMGWLAAQKGQWGAFTDLIYADVGGSKSATRDINIAGITIPAGITADANLDVKSTLWTLAGSYRFVDTPEAGFDLFAGARFIDLKQNLGWQFSADVGPFVGPLRQGSSDVSINHWDAIMGAKGRYSFGPDKEWFVPYYADVGTGQDRMTWQAFAGLGYRFKWGEIIGVWRYIDYHFYQGNGTFTMNGPAVGVGFHW